MKTQIPKITDRKGCPPTGLYKSKFQNHKSQRVSPYSFLRRIDPQITDRKGCPPTGFCASGSIAPNILKGNPSENLALSNRCLQVWKTQRFDSTKLSELNPSENLMLSSVCCPCLQRRRQRFDSIKFSEKNWKRNPSENLALSNRCLQVWNTQRFDSTEFAEGFLQKACFFPQ